MPPPTDPDDAGRLTPGEPVRLDEGALDKLRAFDPDGRQQVLQRVLQTYDSSARRLLAVLAEAREQADWVTAERAVHTLKSSSAYIGALDYARRCGTLEQRLRDGDHAGRAGMAGELASLGEEGARVLAAVQAMLQSA
jgi:HPt (histidine-containing phosphotransfer) domain-containing protein